MRLNLGWRLTAFCAFGCWMVSAADMPVSVRFAAKVGDARLSCGEKYPGIGPTKSTISPRDFRFYISNVLLTKEDGSTVPVVLEQDGKWQLDDVALLDFEDGRAGCLNGTPEMNEAIRGTLPAGSYRGLRFTLGVPFNKNHQDLAAQPAPLNLTALFWAWNSGHKFARLDFTSTGQPRGVAIHLGSTGCTPRDTKTTVPTQCSAPNRVEVEFNAFDIARDVVVADLAELLRDLDVDQKDATCMSGPSDPTCAPIMSGFGLPFGGQAASPQRFFRREGEAVRSAAAR